MPGSMDSPSAKRLPSDSEAESADKITKEDFQSNILAGRAKAESADELNPKDRISSLPEDAIGFILSLLTSREAQATCLLSRRWRHLSTCQVTNLDFDWSHLLAEMKANPEIAEKERARYVQWVDNVLHRQSGGYHLRRFALRFDLNISYKPYIDRWIRFALAKRVKVLQLDFKPALFKDLTHECDPGRLPYLLGHETLMDDDVGCSQRTSGLSHVGLSPSISWHVGFRYLEELCLNRVTMDGELVEQLLANCPKLERLVLEEARTLTRFRVSSRSLKLKYLRILWCDDLEYVEIYDTDLVSFSFVGMRMLVCLDKLPQLSEVSIRGSSLQQLHVMLPPQLSSLPCVQILKLEFFRVLSENLQIRQLPKLTSVKQLILRVSVTKEASLLPLTLVIEACPCMRSFVLELMFSDDMLCRQRKLKRVDGPPHRYLKEVEFHNYYGRPCDFELVIYLVDNAIALEKLVVSPCEEEMVTVGGERKMLKKLNEPRERAWQQLKGNLPSKIDLVIN